MRVNLFVTQSIVFVTQWTLYIACIWWKSAECFDCSVPDCNNSIALAMELLQSCTKPLIFFTSLMCVFFTFVICQGCMKNVVMSHHVVRYMGQLYYWDIWPQLYYWWYAVNIDMIYLKFSHKVYVQMPIYVSWKQSGYIKGWMFWSSAANISFCFIGSPRCHKGPLTFRDNFT